MPETRQARWEEARTLYPSTEYTARRWAEYFDEHPDVLTKLLGDTYRVFKTEQQKRAGASNPQGGRRRSYVDGNLDELWSILTPRFSMEPFPVAVRELMGDMRLRPFAAKCGMDHRELSRLIAGRYQAKGTTFIKKPDRYVLEQIARGADVHPAFFREWRAMVVADVLTQVFEDRPHLSITALRALGRRTT